MTESATKSTADLHVHTKDSPDLLHNAKHTLEEALAEARMKGLTAIAITEHGPKLHDYNSSQKAARREKVILVPGVELRAVVEDGLRARVITKIMGRRFATVDVLALGVTKEILEAELTLDELVKAIHAQDGLAIMAHPFYAPGVDLANPVANLISPIGNLFGPLGRQLIIDSGADGIEAFNAAAPASWNRKSAEFAKELGMPVTGGSDTRTLRDIGKGVTVFSPDVTIKRWEDVLEVIKSGNTTATGTSRRLGPFFAM